MRRAEISMKLFQRIKKHCYVRAANWIGVFHRRKNRRRLKNRSASVLSQNCVGCVISHDLGCRFNSPTVNLYLSCEDFLTLVEELDSFEGKEIAFLETDDPFPVGVISAGQKSITVYFVHYRTREEAREKWHTRFQRIDRENIRVIMTDRDGFSEDTLERFRKLPYKKLLFTAKELNIPEAVTVDAFRGQEQVGDLVAFQTITGKRYFEAADIVEFLNG